LSSLSDNSIKNSNDLEALMRRLQFLSQKDPSILLKYNQLMTAVSLPSQNFYDTLQQNNVNINELLSLGLCMCDSGFSGFQCKDADTSPNPNPSQCYKNETVPSCNPQTSVCKVGFNFF
jgi:hypothetical protein